MDLVCGGDVLDTDYRTDILCESIDAFMRKGIDKEMLRRWKRKYSFIYPWDKFYGLFRQNVNRLFNVFPLIIALCQSEYDIIKSYEIARKYNFDLAIRSGCHCAESYSLSEGDDSRSIIENLY